MRANHQNLFGLFWVSKQPLSWVHQHRTCTHAALFFFSFEACYSTSCQMTQTFNFLLPARRTAGPNDFLISYEENLDRTFVCSSLKQMISPACSYVRPAVRTARSKCQKPFAQNSLCCLLKWKTLNKHRKSHKEGESCTISKLHLLFCLCFNEFGLFYSVISWWVKSWDWRHLQTASVLTHLRDFKNKVGSKEKSAV